MVSTRQSRMREICKSGSVRGLVADSQKGLATRPTRPRRRGAGRGIIQKSEFRNQNAEVQRTRNLNLQTRNQTRDPEIPYYPPMSRLRGSFK